MMDMDDDNGEEEVGYVPGQEMDAIADTMGEFMDTAAVERVYGEPVTHGDTVVIPAAEVLVAMGYGFGGGSGSGPQEQGTGSGSGGGGGGRTFSRPVAVIIIGPNGARVEPVVDVTKLGLAALTAGGFAMAMVARMMKPRKLLRALKRQA